KEELIWPMEISMIKESLMNRDEREIKQKKISSRSSKIEEFKQKISDDLYLDHAIKKIASDLSRYLAK
ncbi:MAG: hypothetical protein JXN64_15110, partial [Spirochaetes bacterium]|nr:hypothetical protein [Spirochaetota bacterium]